MWLNDEQVIDSAVRAYRESLLCTRPNYIVIDNLFNDTVLDGVLKVLQQSRDWQSQKHTYSALYVDDAQWQQTNRTQQFVKRDIWKRDPFGTDSASANVLHANIAQAFLFFLRGDEFMQLLSLIFDVRLTDVNVANPGIKTNYFRLDANDFVEQHADDSPAREVCMLLYLNKGWHANAGGELVLAGEDDESIRIAPLFNRCVLFDPSSKGSEHWVEKQNAEYANEYRYNVTSWYWSE